MRVRLLLLSLFIVMSPALLCGQQQSHITVVSSLTLGGSSLVGGSSVPLHGVINIQRGTTLDGQIEDGDEGYTIGGDNTTIICAHRNQLGCFVPAGASSDTFEVFVTFLVSAPRTETIGALTFDQGNTLTPVEQIAAAKSASFEELPQGMRLAISPTSIVPDTPTLITLTLSFDAPPFPNTFDPSFPANPPFNNNVAIFGIGFSGDFINISGFPDPTFVLIPGQSQASASFTVEIDSDSVFTRKIFFGSPYFGGAGFHFPNPFAFATLNVVDEPQQRIRIRLDDVGTGRELSHFDTILTDDTAPRQTLKLGQEVRVFIFPILSDGSEGPLLSATESMSDVQDRTPKPSQIFTSLTELFAGKTLIHFPLPTASKFDLQFHRLFPIHSGTANVHFAFQNEGKTYNLTLPIEVKSCARPDCSPQLGSLHPEFDPILMDFADRNGVPPQLLKAQIAHESNFDPNAFRYEPLSVDFGQIVAPRRKNAAFAILHQAAFAPWALAEATDCTSATTFLAQGSNLDLSSHDATARQKYSLGLDVNGRPLCRMIGANQASSFRSVQPSDTLPSMENILFTNDANSGWFASAMLNRARTDLRFLDYQAAGDPPFTAQTVIASSYGLHQVMYPTALAEGFKSTSGAGLPPGNLFDPSISMDLGTQFLAVQFTNSDASQESDYTDSQQFLAQFLPALRGFNAGSSTDFTVNQGQAACQTNPIPDAKYLYACAILQHAADFIPAPIQ